MPNGKRLAISVVVSGCICLALMYWYQWSASPLNQAEIEHYLERIEAQEHEPGGRHDLKSLRAFLENDDGQPIYTVNMYEFHEAATYPQGSSFSGTGVEAFDRFSEVMLKLMAVRASHPVFGSNWADASNSEWDRIVVVRYRSRRDLVDLFATDEFATASLHKWASIRRHDRMIVQALHIPGGKWLIFLLTALAGLGTYLSTRLFRYS